MRGKISVIVPVYNAEKYFDKCIQSIVNQTYRNLEIILVDDGSPDDCPEMCDNWAKVDKRIKVIHQKNKGQSAARNAGLDIAKGEYIGFVDSDDWINEDMYMYLIKLANKYNCEIAQCSFIKTYTYKEPDTQNGSGELRVLEKHKAILELYNADKGTDAVMPVNKIYKKELFNRIRYPEGRIFEDAATTYKVFYEANNIVISNRKLYYYYQSDYSTTRVGFQPRRIEGLEANREEIDYFNGKNEKEIAKNAEGFYCNQLIIQYRYFYSHGKDGEIACKSMNKEMKRVFASFAFNGYIKLKTKLRLACLIISPKLYFAISRIKQKRILNLRNMLQE